MIIDDIMFNPADVLYVELRNNYEDEYCLVVYLVKDSCSEYFQTKNYKYDICRDWMIEIFNCKFLGKGVK